MKSELGPGIHGSSGSSARDILRWASERFGGALAVSSSFQTQSVPLLHLIATTVPELPVLFVDTGYHFPETLSFRDRLVREWRLNVRVLKAAPAEPLTGELPLYRTNPDLCCELRKVEPVRVAMSDYRGWVSGIRRDQSSARATADFVETTPDGLTRIHPLLDWTHADVLRYIEEHRLPRHPLYELGFRSLGCLPCTCLPDNGDDPRSGRWRGQGKTECGLHTNLRGLDAVKAGNGPGLVMGGRDDKAARSS